MSKKKIKGSYFKRYNKKEQLWIPHRYILYSYWFEFIKIAHKEKRKIDWKFYRLWGGKKILDVSFRTWYKHNWKKCLAVKTDYDDGKFPMSSKQVKPEGIRCYIQTYKNKHKDKYEIYDFLVKKGLIKTEKKDGKTIEPRVGETVNRYKRNAEKILDNVCKGIFP